MDPKDDITDAFDDDELRSSIESADRAGQWRDGDAKFVDPKLMAIAEQLSHPPHTTYIERRFAELERRATAKDARDAAAARKTGSPRSAPIDRRQAPAGKTEAPAAPAPTETAYPHPKWLLARKGTFAMALAVFALAAVLQGLVAGFSIDLWLRASAAGLVSGGAWAALSAGRFRAAAIAAAAHLVAFLSTSDATGRTELTAVFLGLFVVLLGSGAAGLIHEESQKPLG